MNTYSLEHSALLGRADAMADFSSIALDGLQAYAAHCAAGRFYLDGIDVNKDAYVQAFMVEATARKLASIADNEARIALCDEIEQHASLAMTKSATVESLPVGEYVKRKEDASKVYKRGAYDRSQKRYELHDESDISRSIFVKRGTVLFFDFTY